MTDDAPSWVSQRIDEHGRRLTAVEQRVAIGKERVESLERRVDEAVENIQEFRTESRHYHSENRERLTSIADSVNQMQGRNDGLRDVLPKVVAIGVSLMTLGAGVLFGLFRLM